MAQELAHPLQLSRAWARSCGPAGERVHGTDGVMSEGDGRVGRLRERLAQRVPHDVVDVAVVVELRAQRERRAANGQRGGRVLI